MRGRRRTCDADARALLRAVADRLSGKRLPSAHGTAQAKAPSLLRLRRGSRDTCCGVARYQAAWWGGRGGRAGRQAGCCGHRRCAVPTRGGLDLGCLWGFWWR